MNDNRFISISLLSNDYKNENHPHHLSVPLASPQKPGGVRRKSQIQSVPLAEDAEREPGLSQKISPQQNQEYPLTIELLPEALQWWSQTRYWLIHKASQLRVPGSFSLAEARKIQKTTQHWDWSIDSCDRKVVCGLNLLALAEGICSKASQQGGEL